MENELIGQAKQFDEKINSIKTQFFSALDDFKKYPEKYLDLVSIENRKLIGL